MRNLVLAFSFLISFKVVAMPSPQYVALAEVAEFGKYVEAHMAEILDSSAELAKVVMPGKHYYLFADKIEIFSDNILNRGKHRMATLHMTSPDLYCRRDVYLEKTMDAWGGAIARDYSLSPEIFCQELVRE